MNIGLHKRPKIETVLTTVYFAGVLISAVALYTLRHDLSEPALDTCYRVVGLTFFIGIMAIYYTARSKDERVVYVDRKNEKAEEKVIDNRQTQIDERSLREIIDSNINVPQRILNEVCNRIGAGQGAIYVHDNDELKLEYGYAINSTTKTTYKLAEGLVGRVAAEGKALYLDQLPEGYITVFSGLGNASPTKLALVPIQSGVIEIATFSDINTSTLKHIEESCSEILK
jgi:hypothetical protein